MTEILSLWRSPLDKVALSQAEALRGRQPQCSIGYAEDFSAMTIYNFGYYVTNYPPNDTALATMLSDMDPSSQGYVGALAFVPQQTFAIDAVPFQVPSAFGIIFVPSAYDSFHFSAAPTTFSWIGK